MKRVILVAFAVTATLLFVGAVLQAAYGPAAPPTTLVEKALR